MSEVTKKQGQNFQPASQVEALLIDEFEIVELEDRLELAGRCNRKCENQLS